MVQRIINFCKRSNDELYVIYVIEKKATRDIDLISILPGLFFMTGCVLFKTDMPDSDVKYFNTQNFLLLHEY
jgi:hypothetical protein